MPDPLPPTFAATREALHAVAEHVLALVRYAAERRIGLVVTPGGFSTPPLADGRTVAVELDELVVRDAGEERRAPISTLGAARELTGLGGGWHGLYPAVTAPDPDRPLAVDRAAARALAEWNARVDRCLRALLDGLDPAPDATITLWPEHFDVATTVDRVNYGGSPGDEGPEEPYAYVGPWDRPFPDAPAGFWNRPFGAALPCAAVEADATVLEFFRRGRELTT